MYNLVINEAKCKACGLCVRACPRDVLALGDHINADGYKYVVVTSVANCIGCACCAINCPDMIISIYKED